MFELMTATNAEQRMTALERFIEHWYGPHRREFGETAVLKGYPELPATLRRFYAFAGCWPFPNEESDEEFFYSGRGGHHLLSLDQVSALAVNAVGEARLRFFMEYQGDWDAITTSRESDPPVWIVGHWDGDDDCEDFNTKPYKKAKIRQVSECLSKFLVTHILMTTVYESENSAYSPSVFSNNGILPEWLEKQKESTELIWEVEPNCCPHYEGSFLLVRERVLVLTQNSCPMQIAALHPAGVQLLRSVLG